MVSKKSLSLPLAILISGLTITDAAEARGLFETLFGGGIKKAKREEFPERPPVVRKAVAAPRISGPSYYTYKADALVRVDFSGLRAVDQTASVEPAAFQPGEPHMAFRASLAGLEGFELLSEKEIAAALTEYYASNPDFLWVAEGVPSPRAADAIRVLGDSASFGLVAADYAVSIPTAAGGTGIAALPSSDMIRFEMALSARVLRYVRDATNGRIDPNRISGYHDLPVKPLDLAATLKAISGAADVKEYLETRHPQSVEYRALRTELEALEASAENDIVVDPKLLLKPGETSVELPKLLSLIARDLDDESGGEFGETLWRMGKSEIYAPELVPAVKAAQKRAGLSADGVVGPRTVAALAGTSKAERIEKVMLALEQLRWLPAELGSRRVFINQPAYTASYFENGAEKLKMRVVVGGPGTQTAFFYENAKQVDYNPYWGVPQSIIVNEMLPRLRRDPGYLDRAGYEVTDERGRRIRSSSVAWGSYGSKIPFNVRQTPSEDNALGELKILFPNKHAIYMHDTPSKNLFQREVRALSHGCVRLQDPRAMAAAVLGASADHIAAKLAAGHSSEQVSGIVPVYMAYFTAWPSPGGQVEYFGDVYGRDAHVQTALEKVAAVRAPGV